MKRICWFFSFSILLSSCKVFFPDRLFKLDEEKLTAADSLKIPPEYIIRAGDILAVGVFSNNGYEWVDVLTRENTSYSPLRYVVKKNGYVLLPMLDSVQVAGMSVRSAEILLSSLYAYYFVNPFIRIDVANRNVMVYRGREEAEIITLDRDDINLLEVIARAGGVPPGGKAYRIRVVRGNLKDPTVFDVDLSTVEGMQQANLAMQADDVVYIESRITSGDVFNQFAPALAFISTVLLFATTIVTLSK